MATLRISAHFLAELDGAVREGGSLSAPFAVTVAGQALHPTLTLADAASADIWLASSGPPTTFDLLWIQSDYAVQVELTTDVGGQVGKEVFTLTTRAGSGAGVLGTPLIIPSNISYANYTEDFAGGTLDVIDRVRVKNSSGETAQILALVIT